MHQSTIDKCDKLYANKTQAYFYGLFCGLICGIVLASLVFIAIKLGR